MLHYLFYRFQNHNFIKINLMKSYYIFILIFFLFPKNLLADGPFLYSLPFDQRIYSEETILESTKEKGINYPDFEKYLTNDKV